MNQNKYVDLHSHILPGIDDGAKDTEETQRMLRIAAREGISDIVVTPHNKANRHNASKTTIGNLVAELQEWLRGEKIPIQLYIGNELLYRYEIDNLLEAHRVCTLADSFYVLVEFSPKDEYAYIKSGIQKLLFAGYRPVLAHAERYDILRKHQEYLEELVDLGVYIQVNTASIEGKMGFFVKRKVLRWIQEELVHVVATDAHDAVKRAPCMKKAASIVRKKCGRRVAKELFKDNPRMILRNELIGYEPEPQRGTIA